MSLTAAPRRRSLVRGAAVGAVAVASGLLGAPAVSAAEDARPVIPLDPPDAGIFLLAKENGGMYGWSAEASEDAPAAAALAQAAEIMPPEVASALGVRGNFSSQSHRTEGAVDVTHGGTLVVRLPAVVDASNAEFTLELAPPDEDDPPKTYESDAPLAADQLSVTPLPGNEYSITLPAAVPPYGPEAILTVDRLVSTHAGTEVVMPLWYFLEFTASPPSAVTVEPTVGVYAHAVCSIHAHEACPGPTVHPGDGIGLTVPSSSLLKTFGYGRLDSAIFALESVSEEEEELTSYDSETHPDLVTVHGPSSARVNVPAGATPGPFYGVVVEGDPGAGFAVTFFEFEVEAEVEAVPVNPGLHSDTGWVEEVREVSPGSTAAVAGGALLLVGGLVTAVAVRPGRRPPLGG